MHAETNIVLVGHSHLQAVMAASRSATSVASSCAEEKYAFVPIDAKSKTQSPLLLADGTINMTLGDALLKAGLFEPRRQRVLVSIMAGNIHNATGLIQQDPEYDVVIPGRPDLQVSQGVRTVPVEQFLHYFRKHYAPFVDFLKAAGAAAKPQKVLWIEPPPPIADNEHISRNLDQWFKNNYSAERLTPAPAVLRYKLWLLNRIALQEAAKKEGWTFLTAPETAIDENGFLVRHAWAGDATHGSAWYGEEVLKKIKAAVASS
ncbi:hypothetical protein [Ciceribacter thiooxidans]|uniref:SGNH/GDSL hydrolase family protein n=1 Tax=Ciceribacter thiooxidans TaxID=1969821 RepID=A0ABV7I2I0_9HYPH|nr:hypothetical protein [Ciceribacter thiooxidans]